MLYERHNKFLSKFSIIEIRRNDSQWASSRDHKFSDEYKKKSNRLDISFWQFYAD